MKSLQSVNLFTSTIKSTLQKGNSLIRPQSTNTNNNDLKYNKQYNKTSQLLQIQGINSMQMYQKIRQYTQNNSKIKKNIINILNYMQLKWSQFTQINNKNGLHYNQFLHKFTMIETKLTLNVNKLLNDDNIDQINSFKLQCKKVVQYLNQKARKYVDKNKQITNLIKRKQKQQNDEQTQQQAIKQQMLELLDRLKGQALNIGSDLKKDNVVIEQIHNKQDKQIRVLQNKSGTLDQMIKSQRLGFFQLVFMGVIAIIVWLFTLMFIMIF